MFDYIDKTITEINQAFREHTLTSEQLVLDLLKRITTIDQGPIRYNSVLEINPDALNIAKMLDRERIEGHIRSSIHGIPVLLKDNINTNDKMHTTAGSVALQDHYAHSDAHIVSLLREKGAIILGKTNLTEFANFMSYDMRNGYSSLGGSVLCAHNTSVDPSGSSAGSAVAVALNLTPLAIGTETGGSIMSPSMKNGVVGLKPTIGHISRTGIIPISSTLDTAGPIAKNVTDIAYALTVLKSKDEEDPVTLVKDDSFKDYTECLNIDGLQGKTIGIVRAGYDKLSKQQQNVFDHVIQMMNDNGASVQDGIEVEEPTKIFDIMKYEFKRCINHYLATSNVEVSSLSEIIEYNKQHKSIALEYGQALLEDCDQLDQSLTNPDYIAALSERSILTKQLNEVFDTKQIDVLLFASYTSLGPCLGFPSMTIPIGFDEDNMPIGSYFLAQHNQEEVLIETLYSIEQALQLQMNPLKK